MKQTLNIVWFRQDLRLNDNPALIAASKQNCILPVYILDDKNADGFALGAASRWWLHHSLRALDSSLHSRLNIYHGDAARIIIELCQRFDIESVHYNRCYEPWRILRDRDIERSLLSQGIHVSSSNGSLVNEPWTVLKKDNTPYQIFTPYYHRAVTINPNTSVLTAPGSLELAPADARRLDLSELSLLPAVPWDAGFYNCWVPGEAGAAKSLNMFLRGGINHYKEARDFPALNAVSRLSPHLHFGEVSPRQLLEALLAVPEDNNIEHFRRQLYWREFSYYLLYHFPDLPNKNLKTSFDHFSWEANPAWLARWQQGATGYPLVDAGMRELRQTGFMHNRLRMVTASFLVKNLLFDWRLGAEWFWDCLVDADLANNSASWQWVAGCGTDAAPYFRIFNPVTQGEKFDPDGVYTRSYVPELKNLPNKYLFRPWDAPAATLAKADIILGESYPLPVVDIKISRQKALDTFRGIKNIVDERSA